jgi:hypothetical protein
MVISSMSNFKRQGELKSRDWIDIDRYLQRGLAC